MIHSCQRSIHKKVSSGLNASEIKVLQSKSKRLLKFYFEDSTNGLLSVPKLIKAIDELKTEVTRLKAEFVTQQTYTSVLGLGAATSNNDRCSEIQERQRRANNMMMFNIPEGQSDRVMIQQLVSELAGTQTDVLSFVRVGKKDKNGAIKAT